MRIVSLLAAATLLAGVTLLSACSSESGSRETPPQSALRVAQEFVDGYYHQFPEEAFEIAYPDTPMDKLGDRSEAALRQWDARVDTWRGTLEALDPATLEGTDAAIPYAFTLDRL